MLITAAHLRALHALETREVAGNAIRTLTEQEEAQESVHRELELQGLVALEPPRSYRLTYAGHEALDLLRPMYEAKLLSPPDQIEETWRFLGSDILAALQAAHRNKGRVGPLTETLLHTRGFAEQIHDSLEQTTYWRLNSHGESWVDFAWRYPPRLEVTGDLANSLHHMQPGYTERALVQMPDEHIALLEVLELLSWSVPERTLYALTALGKAVYDAVRKEGYPLLDTVLNEAILETLALLVDRGKTAINSEQMATLQLLGYVDLEGDINAAGEAAMRAYALMQEEKPLQVRTFALTEAEGELLATIHQLAEPANGHPRRPDKKLLHRMLVDRMVKRYQQFVGRYGRKIREREARKRQALAMIEQMKDHDKWFNSFWDLDELLFGLEAFNLLRAEHDGTKTVYQLTTDGQRIVKEQEGEPRDITATAVKVLTTTITRFQAFADPWVEQAREENLIGTEGITRSGQLYAYLAQHCMRSLQLTQIEAMVLAHLPQTGKNLSATSARGHSSLEEEKEGWALEKLEAFGFIDRLVDNQVIRTGTGSLLAKAISGAMHLGHPVTPTLVRLLTAIRQVGTLYVKERKVRLQPHQWAEVERLTGMGPQEFRDMIHVARMGQYIGETALTEAGLELLEVQELLNSEPTGGFVHTDTYS